jgi:arylformamidase
MESFLIIHDISLTLSSELISWPGEGSLELTKIYSISNGDNCNVTKLSLSTHQGTHIDSPHHFIDDGRTSEDINLESLIGLCLVIDVVGCAIINKEHIDKYDFNKYKRIIFKTNNSSLWKENIKYFDKNFVSLSLEAAQYLYNKGVILVGIDYLSIEEFSSTTHAVHKVLLGNNIVIIEGLNLSDISEGCYELICLPIKLRGSDGSPARAVLRELKNN